MVQLPVVELVVLLPVALGACASSQLVIVKEPAVAVAHHAVWSGVATFLNLFLPPSSVTSTAPPTTPTL